MASGIRIEAESFTDRPGFRIENQTGIASNDSTLRVAFETEGGPAAGVPVTARTAYAGPAGTFDVTLGTFDESDGDARVVVSIGGVQVADFLLDQSPGDAGVNNSTAVRRNLVSGLAVNPGDLVEVTVYRQGGEYVRLDYLDFIPAGAVTGPVGPVGDSNDAANLIVEGAAPGSGVGIVALAEDPDLADTVTYAVGDPRFQVDASGRVSVAPGATFDATGEPAIDLTVTAHSSDGSTSIETFEVSVIAPPPAAVPMRLEAEAFDNRPDSFSIQQFTGVASGDQALRVNTSGQGGPGPNEPVTTSTTYRGASGRFDIVLGTFDESDGNSRIMARVGGKQVADFVLDENPGSAGVDAGNAIARQVAASLAVKTGDLIEVTVWRDGGEYVRLDYIDLIPKQAVRLEVEDFDTRPDSFSIQSFTGIASGDLALRVDDESQGGPAQGGSATTSTTYTGPSGRFDVALGTFDESDGASRVVVHIDGQQVADFILDGGTGNAGVDAGNAIDKIVASNLTMKTGDLIELTVFRDRGEYVRLDYLDLIPADEGPAAFRLGALDGTSGFRIEGLQFDTYPTTAAKGAGDVNGDGIDDFIIGAEKADANGNENAGQAYVIFGTSNGSAPTLHVSSLDGANGFRLEGNLAGDRAGNAVSGAGDINGDGIADLIVGTYDASPNGPQSGAAYVVFGSTAGFGPTLHLSALNGDNGFTLEGTAFSYFGSAVSNAGDINGDGLDDLIVSAPQGAGFRGESFVVFGSTGGFASHIAVSDLNGSNGFRLVGASDAQWTGWSVSDAGDVNGDGLSDLIISAHTPNCGAGGAYVVFGTTAGFSSTFELSSIDGTNGFQLAGYATCESAGNSIAGAVDINGDGFDDIILGADNAYYINEDGTNYRPVGGKAYVIFGSDAPFQARVDLSALNGENGLVILGQAEGGSLGVSVSSAGDFNGDGFEDLIIGDTGVGARAGASYVLFGSIDGFGPTLSVAEIDGSNGFRLDGIDPGDRAGYTVSSAGDVNGDGFDDLVVVARGQGTGGNYDGEAYVIFGGPAGPGSANPGYNRAPFVESGSFAAVGDAPAGAVVGSVQASDPDFGDTFSFTIASGNEDGLFTIDPSGQISLAQAVTNELAAGRTLVVEVADGKGYVSRAAVQLEPLPPSEFPLSGLTGANGFRVNGIAAGDYSGGSVSEAGDINGDGIGDFVIGASSANSGAGESYVVFGSSGGFSAEFNLSSLNGTNGFKLNGIEAGDRAGNSVSGAGDINGDGVDDLIIGANGADPSASYSGEAYVVFGSTAGTGPSLDLSSLDGLNGFTLHGSEYGELGAAVSGAGDVNGDGIDDIIVSAPRVDVVDGASYVVFGSTAGFAPSIAASELDGGNGFRLSWNGSFASAGEAISNAGDVNGDGIGDLIISTPFPNCGVGGAYVIFGTDQGFAANIDLSAIDGTNGFAIIGIDDCDSAGDSVGGVGDINGDGFDDILIGAVSADYYSGDGTVERFNVGEAYLVFGASGGFASNIALSNLDGQNGFLLTGIDEGDHAGRAVSIAGDLNGDGFDEIIIGAPYADPNGESSGAIYVMFGASGGFASRLDLADLDGANGFRLDGIDAGDGAGAAVSGAGDINADGYDDLLVAGPGADPGGIGGAGETYVLFGGPDGPGISSGSESNFDYLDDGTFWLA